MYYSIAIDGPAGAGKSTIAKEIANILFMWIREPCTGRSLSIF